MGRDGSTGQGFRVLGLGVLAMGLVSLAMGLVSLGWQDFVPGQPVPGWVPAQSELAMLADGFQAAAGALLCFRRTRRPAAAALAGYFLLVAALLLNVPVILADPRIYGSYFGLVESLAIGMAALVVWADRTGRAAGGAALPARSARSLFGICVLYFGGAHFVYLNLTVPLVPTYLPPSPVFWAAATGLCQIAAGLALLSGIGAGLAALLLTVMYGCFTPLVHVPQVLGKPGEGDRWSELALNLALTGAAWVFADYCRRRRAQPAPP